MADPGEGPGGPAPPYFLDQTEARRAEKFFSENQASPLFKGLDDHPSPTSPPLISRSGSGTDFNVSDCSTLSTLFSTCQALKAWFGLSRMNLYRNDLRGNKNYFELARGLSYRGFELLRVKL